MTDSGLRDMVDGCDAGDANTSIVLCANAGCFETMLLPETEGAWRVSRSKYFH